MRGLVAVLAISGLVAVSCADGNVGRSSATPNPDSYDESPTAVIGNAAILDPAGKIIGLASFRETRQGVRIDVKLLGGIPDGEHGIHIHAVGKCDGPDFTSAGGHFNPGGGAHGIAGTPAAHAGDLPNLVVKDGKGSLLFYDPEISLNKASSNGLTFGAGTAVVIHANKDDEKTDPAGNSGARIACGVVKLANP